MKRWNCPIRAAQYEDVLQLVAEMMGPDTSGDEEAEFGLPQPVSVGMDAQPMNMASNPLPTAVVAEAVFANGPTKREQADPR